MRHKTAACQGVSEAFGGDEHATEFERMADFKIENWTLPIRPPRR
jgi:hypothetical protein